MKKDKIFFGDNGLTSTSSNHIANLAKEYISEKESIIKNLRFQTTTISIIGSAEQTVIEKGNVNINEIPSILSNIAKAKSLIAWLREAIKAKERLQKEVNNLTLQNYCSIKGIEYPSQPECTQVLTEDEYYSNLSLKERNRYYELETKAAVIGKAIHPDGTLATARKSLAHYIQNPHRVSENGRDTIIYNYTPTVSIEEIERLFFELQKKHREVQAELNSIKHSCEQAINESIAKADAEQIRAYKEYSTKLKELTNEFTEYKQLQQIALGKLKIVIPDSLKSIYETISKLGK